MLRVHLCSVVIVVTAVVTAVGTVGTVVLTLQYLRTLGIIIVSSSVFI